MFAELHVVAVISNPERYKSRYTLFNEFKSYLVGHPAKLTTVELSFGERPHAISTPDDIQLTTDSEIWHKENLINIGISRLPPDWKYVAWVDADVMFARKDWVEETLHQLQHFDIVQMFSEASDLTPQHKVMNHRPGFAHSYVNGKFADPTVSFDSGSGGIAQISHTGFAWAARRETIDNLGGLIDYAILGAADYHMAGALIGRADQTLPKDIHPNYKWLVKQWEARALEHVNYNLGYVDGQLLHYWHGKKENRGYTTRSKILVDEQFDPLTDIKKDSQGVFQLTDKKPELRNKIRQYFRGRNEDDISSPRN